jgi:hypothetical protein
LGTCLRTGCKSDAHVEGSLSCVSSASHDRRSTANCTCPTQSKRRGRCQHFGRRLILPGVFFFFFFFFVFCYCWEPTSQHAFWRLAVFALFVAGCRLCSNFCHSFSLPPVTLSTVFALFASGCWSSLSTTVSSCWSSLSTTVFALTDCLRTDSLLCRRSF